MAQIEIDRAAIVRIDETEVEELVALIDVWNAGTGEFQECLNQGFDQTQPADVLVKLEKINEKRIGFGAQIFRTEQGTDKRHQPVFVCLVRVNPARILLSLTACLEHILLDALPIKVEILIAG